MGSTNSMDAEKNCNKLQPDNQEKLNTSSKKSEPNIPVSSSRSDNRLTLRDPPKVPAKNSAEDSQANAAVAEPTSSNKLSGYDRREIQKASKYAQSNENEMKDVAGNVRNKNYLGLIWDSKVPDKDKRFYYFFSLSASNRTEVLAEIAKYMDFYKEMGDVLRKVKKYGEEGDDTSEENPYMLIQEINEKLSEMYEKAKIEQNFTPSSTVYNLHKSFVKKHEQAENLIKRVECVALKSGLRNATEGWQKSIKQVEELTKTVSEMDKACGKLENFKLESEELLDKCSTLEERCNDLAHHNELLMEKMGNVDRMAQQNATLMEENHRMQQKQDDMMKMMQKIFEQQELLLNKQSAVPDN